MNYGDLVRQPGPKLAEICNAIGMEYFEGKERFWKKGNNHHLFGSPSVRRQAETRNSNISALVDACPEFSEQARFVEQYVARDTVMKDLIEFLRHRDVSRLAGEPRPERFLPRQPFPPWYYWQRAKQWYGRLFPRELPTNQLNEKVL